MLPQKATDDMLAFLQELRKVGAGLRAARALLNCESVAAHHSPALDAASRRWPSVAAMLSRCRPHPWRLQTVTVGIVGGSDLHKIAEQLGDNRESALR